MGSSQLGNITFISNKARQESLEILLSHAEEKFTYTLEGVGR